MKYRNIINEWMKKWLNIINEWTTKILNIIVNHKIIKW